MLYPKLFTTLKGYSKDQLLSDSIAGVIVGIVAIPLAIAFAIASGVSPEKGIITAIVAGFLISILGGSRVQIGGPTGAFVVIVYGIVQQYGVNGLIVATFMAGILLIIMGVMRMGAVIQFIPHPVVVGFTSGIALVIFSSQVRDFFGLEVGSLPADFLEKWKLFIQNFHTVNIYAAFVAFGTVVIIGLWPKVSRKIPGSLIALILFSILAYFLNWPVETIGTRFGELPHALPSPTLPEINFKLVQDLMKPAFTIALLGAIESLLSAVVSDGMIGGRHRSNMELVAQGIANMASALFGGMPATGAIARTVTNIKNGGKTPVAGIVHALTVLVIVLSLGRWVKLIPLSCLAGILVVVAYNMSEWRSFWAVLRGQRSGIAVLMITFLITVLFDLTLAIELGMVLSMIIFMQRMSRITHIKVFDEEVEEDEVLEKTATSKIKIPEGVEVYEINGPFFFGVSHQFEEAVRVVSKMPKVRILKLAKVPMIDATGLNSLMQFYKKCKRSHIKLIIAGIHVQPLNSMKKSGLYDSIGKENIFANTHEALKHAREILDASL